MKKRILFFILALVMLLPLASCGTVDVDSTVSVDVSAIPDASQEESKEAQEESKTTVTEVKGGMYNVREFGAKANGQDDSKAIQTAINVCAAKGGGTVYLPAGTYTIKETIVKKAKVSLKGDGMYATYLSWDGEEGGAMINTANESLWGTSIEQIFFNNPKKIKDVIGILGGSTLKNYNSAIGSFKDLVFFGLGTGICGNAEPAGVGIFDCYFENVFCSDCDVGLHLYGSGNTIVHPRIATCKVGLCLDYLNGESFDGVHVIGGIFAANTKDILVPNQSGLRPCDFVGTWFETAKEGILTISNPNTRIMNITFRDCMLNSSADNKNFFLFDARNALGVVTLDSCTVVDNKGIKGPSNSQSVFEVKNLQVYDGNGAVYQIKNEDGGKRSFTGDGKKTEFLVGHTLNQDAKTVSIVPASADMANAKYYVTVNDKRLTITFLEAPKKDAVLEFYWHVEA